MSTTWSFVSFNLSRFQQVFGKATDQIEAGLLKVLEFELGTDPDDEISQMAKRIAHNGISYDGLNPREMENLDQILGVAFGQEGLWTELELESQSPEPLPVTLINELLRRAEGQVQLEVLPVLKKGRRYRQPIGPECRYCILDRLEVGKLAEEVRAIMALPGDWATPNSAMLINDGLLMPCEYVNRKQRPMAGVMS